MKHATLITIIFVLAGCSDTTASPDATPPGDARSVDAPPLLDSRLDGARADAMRADSFTAEPGLGAISGACGILDEDEWSSTDPALFINAIDFGAEAYAVNKLSPGGQEIVADGNLGGDSVLSEVFAYELLYRCEGAVLLKTEGEIIYDDKGGKKTDLLLSIDERKVGVSVTRAFHYPVGEPYTRDEAVSLLEKKLGDILLSAANASDADRWQRSVLHILAFDPQHAEMVQQAYAGLDAATRHSTLVMITVTDGDDAHIY